MIIVMGEYTGLTEHLGREMKFSLYLKGPVIVNLSIQKKE
jgi:hypothetical protein